MNITNLHIENLTITNFTIQIIDLLTPTGGGASEEPSAPGAPTSDRFEEFGVHGLSSSSSGDGDIAITAEERIAARPAELLGPNSDPRGELIMPRDGPQGREEEDNMDVDVKIEKGPLNENEKATQEEEHDDGSSSDFSISDTNLQKQQSDHSEPLE